jgi:hypothetical protein
MHALSQPKQALYLVKGPVVKGIESSVVWTQARIQQIIDRALHTRTSVVINGGRDPGVVWDSILDELETKYSNILFPKVIEPELTRTRIQAITNTNSFGGITAAQLPYWPTWDHVRLMIATGKVKKEDFFSSNQVSIPESVSNRPQIFENVVRDQKILQRMFLGSENQARIVSGEITHAYSYLMNHAARLVFAEILGGKLATWDQLCAYWNGIPGNSVNQKMMAAQIPQIGCHYTNYRDFYDVGHHTDLFSSTLTSDNSPIGLSLDRSDALVTKRTSSLDYGSSGLVIFE